MRRHLPKRERIEPPSPLDKPLQAKHKIQAARLILCSYVKSSGGYAALELHCGGEMYSGEYNQALLLTFIHDSHISTAPPKSTPLPEISAALKPLAANYTKNIVHYLFYVVFITNSFTGYIPKAQSNRRTAVGWSSSKAAAHVVYYVRTFRHGSQLRAHHPGAADQSTRATGHRRRSAGPVPSKNSPPYLRAGVKRSRPSHF